MSDLCKLIEGWAEYGESEIRIHAGHGYPADIEELRRIRRSTEAYVQRAILGCLDELLQRPDGDEIIARRRAELAEMARPHADTDREAT